MTWRLNIYVSRQVKGINGRNESENSEIFLSTDDNIQRSFFFPTLIVETVEKQFDFLHEQDTSVLIAIYFFRRKWQL